MLTFEQVKKLSRNMIKKEQDLGNSAMMDYIYKMMTGDWALEGEQPDFWRDQPASDPFDAVRDATDLFGGLEPKLSMTPYSGDPKDRRNADQIEQNLMWQMKRAIRRRGNAQKQMVEDAFKYGRVANLLLYLPYHKDTMKVSERRMKAYSKHGDFAMVWKDARGVFPLWSDFMLEGVLHVEKKSSLEVLKFWGDDLAKGIKDRLDENADLQWCTVFDYWDYDQRAVWVKLADNPDMPELATDTIVSTDGIELFNDSHDLPFLPWVVRDMGEKLEPLLYPIYKFNYWHTMNLLESAMISEIIAYIAAPRFVIKNGEVTIQYGEAGSIAELEGLNAELDPLPPAGLDPGLVNLQERLKARLNKSTISHNVQTGDFGSGNPYSAIREIIDLQSRRLNDGKSIIQDAFSDNFELMLRWADYTGKDLVSYGERKQGGQITITPPQEVVAPDQQITFNPERLYFKVTMIPDIPQDQVARINAAQMYFQLGGSLKNALEQAGESDPDMVIQDRRFEDLEEAEHQVNIEIMRQSRLREFERQQMVADAQAQQATQPQQPQPMNGMFPGNSVPPMLGPGGGGEGMVSLPEQQPQGGTGVGFENLGGQINNPAAGGSPPILGNPGGTREAQQGRNRR